MQVKYIKLVAAINIGFLGAVVLVTQLAFHGSLRITLIGILCAGLTIGMYAAPLAAMVISFKYDLPNIFSYIFQNTKISIQNFKGNS